MLNLVYFIFWFCCFPFLATLLAYGGSLEQGRILRPLSQSRNSIPGLCKVLGLALSKAIWVLMPLGWCRDLTRCHTQSSHSGSLEINLTSIHEDASSIPDLIRGLRIQHCCELCVG